MLLRGVLMVSGSEAWSAVTALRLSCVERVRERERVCVCAVCVCVCRGGCCRGEA
jgi:hypothetical protein